MTASKQCHECLAIVTRARDAKPERRAKANVNRNTRRAENLDAARAYGRSYAALHAAENAEIQKKYRIDHPDRVKISKRKTYDKTFDLILVRNQRRRALKKGAVGSHTTKDVAEIRVKQHDKCANPACRIKLHGKGHVDHIIALTKGGSDYRENLQILCGTCNLRKGNKDPIDFMQSQGFLI